jgi:hypothetical protein
LATAFAGRLRGFGRDWLTDTALRDGALVSAKSGGIGVGMHESAVVRILRATRWIAFATSWVCRLILANSCAATVKRFTSSFALVEVDRSAATL